MLSSCSADDWVYSFSPRSSFMEESLPKSRVTLVQRGVGFSVGDEAQTHRGASWIFRGASPQIPGIRSDQPPPHTPNSGFPPVSRALYKAEVASPMPMGSKIARKINEGVLQKARVDESGDET